MDNNNRLCGRISHCVIFVLSIFFLSIVLSSCSFAQQSPRRPEFRLKTGMPIVKITQLKGNAPASYAQSTVGAGNYSRHIVVGGMDRFYEVHVPAAYTKTSPMPAVLVLHGGGGNPTAIRWQSRMDYVADRYGFIAVYPAGTSRLKKFALTFNAEGCCGYASENNVDDVAYVNALLDDLEKFFYIDTKRVFATGYSNGSQMTYLLACKLSHRIAAIAPNAAPMTLRSGCAPVRPLSVMHFHGLKDDNVPFEGGKGTSPVAVTGYDHMPVQDCLNFWITRNGIPATPAKQSRKGNVEFTVYGPGEEDTEVILVKIEDGGHSWPGGDYSSAKEDATLGKINRDIVASELMWKFFEKHPMR
ncbi:MAG: hypothetical protein KBA46_07170 [Candidatus Omnitrophica bacterium]|nr:hypothetical protein [Candidatus Omnitrophota bacterium]